MQKLFSLGISLSILFMFSTSFVQAQVLDKDLVSVIKINGDETQTYPATDPEMTSSALLEGCEAAPPTLLMPSGGSSSNDLVRPRFTWSIVSGINEYIIQIADEESFSQPLRSENAHTRANRTEVIHYSFRDLRSSTTYFWRVASVCAGGQIGTFSAPASFQTGNTSGTIPCPAEPPVLLTPENGSTVETLLPTLHWSTVENIPEYSFEVSKSSSFTNTVKSGVLFNVASEIITSTGISLLNNLELGTTYYWRVASICAELDTTGKFSEPAFFQTTTNDSNLPMIEPKLLFPTDGATTGSIRVTLHYTKTADATNYQVQFSRSRESAESGSWFSSIITSNSSVVAVFNPEETIYWAVYVRNQFGWGTHSAVRMFTTPKDEAASEITAEAGGTLQPAPGYLTLTFPPSAVVNPTTVNFHLLTTPQQPLTDFTFANRAFSLEASSGGISITQFAQPYTMVIRYDEGDLLSAGINDPNQLNLLFWDGSKWEAILPCAGCGIDTTAQTLTVKLNHFTDFVLVGPLPARLLYLPLLNR